MSTGTYRVFGAGQTELLGRQKEIGLIRRRWLTQHISIVGPKYYGKSILMEHLQKLAADDKGFAGVALWSVRRNPPKDDTAFWRKLYHCLNNQIPIVREFLPEAEKLADAESMLDAFRWLKEEQKRILLLWDGVDELLLKGDLSDNLWDQLTSLADMQSATLILTSRRRLMDLLPTDEARGSDFWRRFNIVIPLGCFQETDWPALVAPLSSVGVEFDSSAQKEVVNWSGGVPILTVALLETIQAEVSGRCVLTKANVDTAADKMDARGVEMVWRDLDSELQNEFAEVCRRDEKGGMPRGEIDAACLAEMEARGLVAESGNKFRSAVRLLTRHAVLVTIPMPNLRRLFASSDTFITNAHGMLELRLAQAGLVDASLKYHVSQILKGLDHPSTAMELIRGVFDRTAELVLKSEFPDGKLPSAWVKEWEQRGKLDRNDPDRRNRDILDCRVPKARAERRWLLRLLVNSDGGRRTKLRSSTFLLMEFVYEAGTYGHHARDVGEDIPVSFAMSACFATVELCHHLTEDLKR